MDVFASMRALVKTLISSRRPAMVPAGWKKKNYKISVYTGITSYDVIAVLQRTQLYDDEYTGYYDNLACLIKVVCRKSVDWTALLMLVLAYSCTFTPLDHLQQHLDGSYSIRHSIRTVIKSTVAYT